MQRNSFLEGEKMIDKDKIEAIVKQWLISGKPNQSIKLESGYMINVSHIRSTSPDISDYRFALFSPNFQCFLWIDGEDINSYFDAHYIISALVWDRFKSLLKKEGKEIKEREAINIKTGTENYDKYTLPPSIDKAGF